MEKDKRKNTAENNAQNAKQNQDFPNLPQTPRLEGASKVEEKQVKKREHLLGQKRLLKQWNHQSQ